MADVVVDQASTTKLPYDSAVIPEAVRKRAAAVDALYQNPSTPEPAQAAPAAQVPEPPAPAPPTPETPAPVAQPGSPEELDPNSNTWKSRALSKEGRERAENEQLKQDLGELQERYFNEVASQQPQPQQRRPAPPRPQQYLTKED